MTDRHKTALVTGASSGIGRAIARALIDGGWRVFGSVRKETDAAAAKAALGPDFTPLIFDVTDGEAVGRAAAEIEEALGGATLGALVNNAGIAVAGPAAHLEIDELRRQFDVNVYGPLRVIQAFLPMLGTDRTRHGAPGRIVNISSVAGRIATPFMAPYAMSKHALEALSDSLRRELLVHGIDVIVIGPGAVRTPIWGKADEIDIERYAHTEYVDALARMRRLMQTVGEEGLEPEAVGRLARHILTTDRPKPRYAILKSKFALWTLPNLLPKRMLDRAMARRFGFAARKAGKA